MKFSRADVFETFKRFINNHSRLQEAVDLGILHYEYVRYKKVFEGTLFEDYIILVNEMCREANNVDREKFCETLQVGYKGIAKGLASFTQSMLANGKEWPERTDLFVKKAFQTIGELIENSLKPYLFFLNEVRAIIKKKSVSLHKLGVDLDALMAHNEIIESIYKGLFMDISISQWRNISDHGDYIYRNEEIEIVYGKNRKVIHQKDLVEILRSLDILLYVNKTAFTLLSLDYFDEMKVQDVLKDKSEYVEQDDMAIQIIETSYAYGYRVKSVDVLCNPIKIEVEVREGANYKEELEKYLIVLCSIVHNDFDFKCGSELGMVVEARFFNRTLFIKNNLGVDQ